MATSTPNRTGQEAGPEARPLTAIVNDAIKTALVAVQDYSVLAWKSIVDIFSPPFYFRDLLDQMDVIGVGSLPIIVLTGFFIGAILVLQTAAQFARFGTTALTGDAVSLALIKELGPTITALLVAGRSASGIASELGSMVVTEQVDAMRALGTDPVRKLVTPRLFATVITLPLLTILADFFGMLGGFFVSYYTVHLTSVEYWTYAYQALTFEDVTQGLLKPFFFAVIVALVGCYFGLTTRGGTEGVGRSTIQAVVTASVLIIFVDFLISPVMIQLFG